MLCHVISCHVTFILYLFNLLQFNRFSQSGRFSVSRISRESGVKIHVRFALRYCRADKSGRQILACKPTLTRNTLWTQNGQFIFILLFFFYILLEFIYLIIVEGTNLITHCHTYSLSLGHQWLYVTTDKSSNILTDSQQMVRPQAT